MDNKLFKEKVKQVGVLRSRWRGAEAEASEWEELVFIPANEPRACSDCHRTVQDRVVHIELRFNRDPPEWRTKCKIKECKQTWPEIRL